MSKHRRALRRGAVVAATALALSGLAVPASPVAAGAAEAITPTAAGGRTWTVTLITGDRITLTDLGAGRYAAVADPVPRPGGRVPVFDIRSSPEEIVAIPDDARSAVDAGILSRSLFDVKYLALNGYADDAAKSVPVIVQYDSAARAFTTAEALPASDATLPLPSVRGAAVTVDKQAAAGFWSAVRGATAPTARPKALAGGISKVWLDRRVTATLADSVPLIGAPQAWQSGVDGTGTTVAVLDTGVDAAHPDLAGKVAASKSFISGQEVADGHGHGTHVAATVAGSGAASGGSHQGVAPGAALLIGKVLDNAGNGADSSVIAGMEWAAAEMDADVVSMSLGAGPTDGTDPLSQAVDSLSASTGALFVVAAGNTGPGRETVAAPGTAQSALTVAATSKTDTLADFSSRGPRAGDGALKPDISAPGVDIVAARAAGTSIGNPVDDRYTSLSGTSMATPHVAGAAAILAQSHPDWTGAQLKAALMSTAHDTGHTVYETGAGRVDVARATAQHVVATTPNLDFGVLPEEQNARVTKDVTYTNTGAADVTLTLTPALRDPDGAATGALTAPGSVTVPAGGSATVTVTLDPAGLGKGTYSGAVVATDDTAGIRVTTPAGLNREPRKVALTVRTTGFDGQPAPRPPVDDILWDVMWSTVSAVDVPDVYFPDGTLVAPGVWRYAVEPGTYAITHTLITTTRETKTDTAFLVDPEVVVTEDTEITLDARTAVPVEFDTPEPTDPLHTVRNVVSTRTAWDGRMAGGHLTGTWSGRTWVTPTKKVTTGRYLFNSQVTLTNPQLSVKVTGRGGFDLPVTQFAHADEGGTFPSEGMPVFAEGTQRRELAYVNLARPEDIAKVDLAGKIAVQRVDAWEEPWEGHQTGCWVSDERVQWLEDAGAVGVLLYLDEPHPGCVDFFYADLEDYVVALPLARMSQADGDRLVSLMERGPVRADVTGHPDIDYTYQLSEFVTQQVPRTMTYDYGKRDLARVDSAYHSAADLHRAQESWHTWLADENFSASSHSPFTAPSERVVYYGGLSPDVLWTGSVEMAGAAAPFTWASFTGPTRTTARWGATPATPGGVTFPDIPGLPWHGSCSMCRLENVFAPLYLNVQSDGISDSFGGYLNLSARLFQDGKEIPKTPPAGLPREWPVYTLPEEEGTYKLTMTHDNTDSAWTFRSGKVTEHAVPSGQYCPPGLYGTGETETPCAPQPLVFVGYDLGDSQDLHNKVAAGGKRGLGITAYHGQSARPMPKVVGLKLWYSTDDGKSWRTADVRRTNEPGGYRTTVDIPALDRTSGAVSLRVEAWDAEGNRIEQTTTRAFDLE